MDDFEKVSGGFDWTTALELDKPVKCEYCGKTCL